MRIRFLNPAEIEMFEASAYYEMQAVNLGNNFLDIIEEATAEIKKLQKRGLKLVKEYEEELYANSHIPYSIAFMQTKSLL